MMRVCKMVVIFSLAATLLLSTARGEEIEVCAVQLQDALMHADSSLYNLNCLLVNVSSPVNNGTTNKSLTRQETSQNGRYGDYSDTCVDAEISHGDTEFANITDEISWQNATETVVAAIYFLSHQIYEADVDCGKVNALDYLSCALDLLVLRGYNDTTLVEDPDTLLKMDQKATTQVELTIEYVDDIVEILADEARALAILIIVVVCVSVTVLLGCLCMCVCVLCSVKRKKNKMKQSIANVNANYTLEEIRQQTMRQESIIVGAPGDVPPSYNQCVQDSTIFVTKEPAISSELKGSSIPVGARGVVEDAEQMVTIGSIANAAPAEVVYETKTVTVSDKKII